MRNWLHGLYAALILFGVAFACWQVQHAAGEIRRAASEMITETQNLKARIAKMLTSSWKDTGGITRTVTGTQRDTESWAQFLDRHDDEVAAAKVKWPVE